MKEIIAGRSESIKGETRQSRAIELFQRGGFERLSRDVIIVENHKNRAEYTVDLAHLSCGCEDFNQHHHIEGFCCKHILAAKMWRDWLRGMARDLAPYFGSVA